MEEKDYEKKFNEILKENEKKLNSILTSGMKEGLTVESTCEKLCNQLTSFMKKLNEKEKKKRRDKRPSFIDRALPNRSKPSQIQRLDTQRNRNRINEEIRLDISESETEEEEQEEQEKNDDSIEVVEESQNKISIIQKYKFREKGSKKINKNVFIEFIENSYGEKNEIIVDLISNNFIRNINFNNIKLTLKKIQQETKNLINETTKDTNDQNIMKILDFVKFSKNFQENLETTENISKSIKFFLFLFDCKCIYEVCKKNSSLEIKKRNAIISKITNYSKTTIGRIYFTGKSISLFPNLFFTKCFDKMNFYAFCSAVCYLHAKLGKGKPKSNEELFKKFEENGKSIYNNFFFSLI